MFCVQKNHLIETVLLITNSMLKLLKIRKKDLNSVQKFCCNVFSKFLLLYVFLGPTSL